MLVLSIGIAHNLSRARARLERRVRELHSLAAIGQAVANSLELPEVLVAIHQQTQQLMDARNFYIALYDENERRIQFPLAYENGERVTYTSRLFGEGFTEYIILSRRAALDQEQRAGVRPPDRSVRWSIPVCARGWVCPSPLAKTCWALWLSRAASAPTATMNPIAIF